MRRCHRLRQHRAPPSTARPCGRADALATGDATRVAVPPRPARSPTCIHNWPHPCPLSGKADIGGDVATRPTLTQLRHDALFVFGAPYQPRWLIGHERGRPSHQQIRSRSQVAVAASGCCDMIHAKGYCPKGHPYDANSARHAGGSGLHIDSLVGGDARRGRRFRDVCEDFWRPSNSGVHTRN